MSFRPVRVLVVGNGIAGAAFGRCLRHLVRQARGQASRAPLELLVLDRARSPLSLSPTRVATPLIHGSCATQNGRNPHGVLLHQSLPVLTALGIDTTRIATTIQTSSSQHAQSDSMRNVVTYERKEGDAVWAGQVMSTSRPALHMSLRSDLPKLARERGGDDRLRTVMEDEGMRVVEQWDSEVIGYQEADDEVIVHGAQGETWSGDVLICADGVGAFRTKNVHNLFQRSDVTPGKLRACDAVEERGWELTNAGLASAIVANNHSNMVSLVTPHDFERVIGVHGCVPLASLACIGDGDMSNLSKYGIEHAVYSGDDGHMFTHVPVPAHGKGTPHYVAWSWYARDSWGDMISQAASEEGTGIRAVLHVVKSAVEREWGSKLGTVVASTPSDSLYHPDLSQRRQSGVGYGSVVSHTEPMRWSRGRAVLLGSTAHLTPPYLPIGDDRSVAGGAVLARTLFNALDSMEPPLRSKLRSALKRYESRCRTKDALQSRLEDTAGGLALGKMMWLGWLRRKSLSFLFGVERFIDTKRQETVLQQYMGS